MESPVSVICGGICRPRRSSRYAPAMCWWCESMKMGIRCWRRAMAGFSRSMCSQAARCVPGSGCCVVVREGMMQQTF